MRFAMLFILVATAFINACQTQTPSGTKDSGLTHIPQPRVSIVKFDQILGALPNDGLLFDLELPQSASTSIASVKITSAEMTLAQWRDRPLSQLNCDGDICSYREWRSVQGMQDQGVITVSWFDQRSQKLGDKQINFALGGGGFVDSRPAWDELAVVGPEFKLESTALKLAAGQYLATALTWYPAEDAPANLTAELSWAGIEVPTLLEATNCRAVGTQKECAALRLDGPFPAGTGELKVTYGDQIERRRKVTVE